MNLQNLQILPVYIFEKYGNTADTSLINSFSLLNDSELSVEHFNFYVSVSAVFSSRIEGEAIELDSYIKHRRMGVKYQPDYTRKIDDLYDAYIFAQQNKLNFPNLLKAHAQLTKHILHPSQQGVLRTGNMYVITTDGKIEYVAATPEILQTEIEKFYTDLSELTEADLSFHEVFFFASLLHLVFVKIHPFEDGNGRTARLLEKWFLAEKLGERAWFLESERYYYQQHQTYYSNIRRLGLEYISLDYNKAIPFLNMLPQSIRKQEK
jgi:Fic family protein